MNAVADLKNLLPYYNKLPLESNKLLNKHLETLDKLTFNLIEKSRQRLKGANKEGAPSLLDSMVETELNISEDDRLTLEELRDQVILFFVAGHGMLLINIAVLTSFRNYIKQFVKCLVCFGSKSTYSRKTFGRNQQHQ